MRVKINNVKGYSGEIEIKTDSKGVPLSQFWRRRLKDAEIDSCLTVLSTAKTLKNSKRGKKGD